MSVKGAALRRMGRSFNLFGAVTGWYLLLLLSVEKNVIAVSGTFARRIDTIGCQLYCGPLIPFPWCRGSIAGVVSTVPIPPCPRHARAEHHHDHGSWLRLLYADKVYCREVRA